MSTLTDTYTGTLVIRTCWCGIRHAMPSGLDDHVDNGGSAFCPLGHEYVRNVRTEAQIERDKNARLEAQLDQVRARAAHLEASRRAHKGANTRLRRRVAAGVCPCCNRTFQNLARHVASQHPDFGEMKETK